METDAAFLEEVKAFLDTNKLALPHSSLDSAQDKREMITKTGRPSVWASSSPLREVFHKGVESRAGRKDDEPRALRLKTRKEKEALRKKRYHQRLKNERQVLRRMENELSQELVGLKRSRTRSKLEADTHVALNTSVWRKLAERQHNVRLRAEVEQRRLVDVISLQASYIDHLCSLLPKRVEGVTEVSSDKALSLQSKLRLEHSLYTSHLGEVDACYARFENVYSECHFASLPEGISTSVHRRKSDGEVEYFQHLNKVVQPFTYEHTSHTMWTLAKLFHRQQDREDYEGLGNPDNIVAIKFRLVRTLVSGVRCSIRQHYVFRRFVGDNRTVFVWKTYSEGEGIFRGMNLHETGWVSLCPSADRFSTMVDICVRQVPMCFCAPSPRDPVVEDFQQVLQTSVDEDAREIITTLDKLLLDYTLADIDI